MALLERGEVAAGGRAMHLGGFEKNRFSGVQVNDKTCVCTLLFWLREETTATRQEKHFALAQQIKGDVQMAEPGKDAVRDEAEAEKKKEGNRGTGRK